MHWRRKWQPTPVFLPEESQGRGSLVGCCLWGRTEPDSTMPAWSLQQLTTVPWREELGRMKMRERAGAGGFPQQTEKPLSKEGTVVHRAGRGTLIPSSKKGYLMPGDSPPTEPVPAGRRPPGEVAEDQCPGVPSLPCRGLQLGFSCTSVGCSHINLKKPLQPLVGRAKATSSSLVFRTQ